MKKPFFERAFGRTLLGKNKAGQVLHGVLDILPFPNLINPLRASVAENPNRSILETIQRSYTKIDAIRLIVALALSYLIVSGKLTAEEAQQFFETLKDIQF